MYYMIIGATCIINDKFKSQNDGRLEYLETFAVLKVSWKNKNLTLLGLGLIKINDVSGNFNNPRPSLILNN